MKMNEKLIKPLTETKYLNVDNTDRYRPIIRLFYLEYEKLRYWMYPEEVFEELHNQGAQHQIYRRAVYAGHRSRGPFHMGGAGGAGHAGDDEFLCHTAISLFHQLLQRDHQFVDDLVVPLSDTIRHAGADVGSQQLFTKAVQCRAHGGYLYQNVGTVGVLLQHLLQAPHLPFNAAQAVQELLLLLWRAVLGLSLAAATSIFHSHIPPGGIFDHGRIIYPRRVFVNVFLWAAPAAPPTGKTPPPRRFRRRWRSVRR